MRWLAVLLDAGGAIYLAFTLAFPTYTHRYRLLETTKAEITRGIEQILPWMAKMKVAGLGGRVDTVPGKFQINIPYFARE